VDNLSVSSTSTTQVVNVRTTLGLSAGKAYWEITTTSGSASTNGGGIGVGDSNMPKNVGYVGSTDSFGFGYGTSNSYYVDSVGWSGVTVNGTPPSNSAIAAGVVYMFALDMSAGKLWIGQNGNWYGSGDPASGANPVATGLAGTLFPVITFYKSSPNAFTADFGGTPFQYTVPNGFQAGFY
jgi:hypothetical protein